MTFPALFTVDHYAWSADGVEDELGNDEGGWAATPVTRPAISWSIGVTEEYASGTTEVYDARLYCPPSWTGTVRDRVVIGGDLFEVVSIRVQDAGFHGWQPGSVMLLRRVSGG